MGNPRDIDLLLRQIDEIMDNIVHKAQEGGAPYLETAYTKGLDKGLSDLKRAGWVGDIPPDPDSIAFLEGYTFDLINGVSAEMKKDIRRVIRQGIIDGKSMSQVARELEELAFTKKVWRLNTIARTEVMRASNFGRYGAYKKSGVVEYKQWLTAFDDRTCPECESMNGEVVPLNKPFSSGDMTPPLHPNCRCTIIPIFKKGVFSQKISLGDKELRVKSIERQFASFLRKQFKEGIVHVKEVLRVYWGVIS
ncbi:MAG: minor capsid protein [Bacillaceae bacterium]|nr:minor capsid protein [Bacillaceae bacterium]